MDKIKDKIILAVKETIAKNVVFATGDYLYAEIDYDDVDHIAEQVADALIAANIGDVTEYKRRAEVAERALRKACEHIDGVAETCAVCAKLADKLKVGEVCDRAENCVDNAIKFLTSQAEREIEEGGVYKPTGVAKLKLTLASEVIVKSENANAECKAKPIDELTCRATLSENELKDTSRVLYLVSRLYSKLISEVAVKGMCDKEDKTE